MDLKIEAIVNQLKQYNPDKIILFGSWAYGKPHEDSDVDVILIKETRDSFKERMKKVQMLLRTTTAVDAFVFTPKEFEKAKNDNLLVQEAVQKGKVVYG